MWVGSMTGERVGDATHPITDAPTVLIVRELRELDNHKLLRLRLHDCAAVAVSVVVRQLVLVAVVVAVAVSIFTAGIMPITGVVFCGYGHSCGDLWLWLRLWLWVWSCLWMRQQACGWLWLQMFFWLCLCRLQ